MQPDDPLGEEILEHVCADPGTVTLHAFCRIDPSGVADKWAALSCGHPLPLHKWTTLLCGCRVRVRYTPQEDCPHCKHKRPRVPPQESDPLGDDPDTAALFSLVCPSGPWRQVVH